MEFKEQITDLELVIDTRPRTYIKWRNTEDGRDKTDCYERMDINGRIFYVNTNNRNSGGIFEGNKFFDLLEELYNEAVLKQNK